MNNIVAIVVTYNRIKYLKECVAALKMSETPVDILIIDNASSDGTADQIQQYVDNETIFYWNTGANIGGAGGFNFGLKKAYSLGYEYFWLMDDDTIVHPDSLTELFKAKKEVGEHFGFLSSMALWVDGSACIMNSPALDKEWVSEPSFLEKGIIKLVSASFVSLLLTKEVIENVGLPIKDYFIWGDDMEYSLRISKMFPCYFVIKSQVTHKMIKNETTKNFAEMTDLDRIDRMSYAIRNDTCTYKREGYYKLFRWTGSLVKKFIQIICSKKPHKLRKLYIILKNYLNGLLCFNPPIEFVNFPASMDIKHKKI